MGGDHAHGEAAGMEPDSFLRVVTLRRGKLKSVEFRLREGESGLSLFAATADIPPSAVLEAVREAGKQGELAVALVSGALLWRLRLHHGSPSGVSAVPPG